jgi:subtilisin family serine protease
MEKEISTPYRPPQEDKEPYAYFKPTEMVFVISHPSDDVPTEQEIDALLDDRNGGGVIGWSDKNKVDPKLKISRVKKRELHFPGTSQLSPPPKLDIDMPSGVEYESPEPIQRKAFSIIPVDVRIADEYRDDNNPEGLVETTKLTELITNLDYTRDELQKDLNVQRAAGQTVTVEVISPNWLSSPAMSEYGGGGGPGSRPVPYNGKPNEAPSEFHLPPKVEQLCPDDDKRGEGVKVAILDTAPCLHDLVEAYEFYEKVRPERRKKQEKDDGFHPLIKTLLKPGGPLHLHPASVEDLDRMRAVHLRDHDYIMTDHGLFVAGIIHSIAPQAELHLYEVLNPQGAGDLESIAGGLWKVFDEQYQFFQKEKAYQPLVVNCSLMLYIPLDGDPDSPDTAKVIATSPRPIVGHRLTDLDQKIKDQIQADSNKNVSERLVVRSGSVIKWICDLLYYFGARVIAAAGNDWDPSDKGRPRARYPAAFKTVQGVGAFKREQSQAAMANQENFVVASYSDISDEPGKVGVTALGGEPGEGKGVLGIYLGEFPIPVIEEPVNTNLTFFERIRRWLIRILGGTLNSTPVRPENKSHWAWWAGTSFATPILSGVIAAVLSRSTPPPPPTTEGVIVELYRTRAIEEARTDYEEDLLKVTQG